MGHRKAEKMTREFCQVCATKWMKQLWVGCCVCSGDVILQSHKQIANSPFQHKQEAPAPEKKKNYANALAFKFNARSGTPKPPKPRK